MAGLDVPGKLKLVARGISEIACEFFFLFFSVGMFDVPGEI